MLDYTNVNPKILLNLALIELNQGSIDNYGPGKLYFKKYFEKLYSLHLQDEFAETSLSILHFINNNHLQAANVIKR